mgnify:FL=1
MSKAKYDRLEVDRTLVASGTNTLSGATTISGALSATSTADLSGATSFTGAPGGQQTATVTLTNAQMLALRATPITIIPAPGAGKWIQVLEGCLVFNYTAVYTESADNLALRYVDGSGAKASADIEATGFVDATADAITNIAPLAQLGTSSLTTAGVISNALVCIHNIGDGEFGGGNAANTVKVIVDYIVRTTSL